MLITQSRLHLAAHSTLLPLDAAYHPALRFITGDKYRPHHSVLYKTVGWFSLATYHYYL